jgi:8-hydroxy-5-deazaflavin:NADPH oxidoreductase
MRITVIGKGNVGGGLARRWAGAGHEVTPLGREGGDASDAQAVLVTVPSSAIADALAKVRGLRGQVTIDATNTFGSYPAGYDSLAQQVKSIVGGPTAKAFNTNFAALYDRVDAEPVRPGTLFAADPEARVLTEQLIRDAGFDPVYLGDLGQARMLESLIDLTMGIARGGLGPFFYRFTAPGGLSGLSVG